MARRLQLVPDGTGRRIQVGTERHGGTTEWFDLREVELTDAGLTTPAVEEVRRLRTTRRPIGVQTHKTAPPQTRPPARATGDETHDVPSADALLRLERAVGVPTPREPTFQERKALQKVQRLLGSFAEQKRHGFPMVTPRQRRQLTQAAEQASAWLTDTQRSQVQAWQKAPTESAPASRAPQPPAPARPPRIPPATPRSERFDEAGLADAVRDVLEHAARLGKTVTFADLRTQIKSLGELTEADQVQVLRRVKPTARPRSPKPQRPALLTALITTESGTMHPIYRQLADHAGHHLPQQADSAWTNTVNILHDRYRTP